MSEHRHKWELIVFTDMRVTYQIKTLCMGDDVMCKAELDSDEIERRLNATECLSAEDARRIYREGQKHGNFDIVDASLPAREYAQALESKDETNPSNS